MQIGEYIICKRKFSLPELYKEKFIKNKKYLIVDKLTIFNDDFYIINGDIILGNDQIKKYFYTIKELRVNKLKKLK